jgi:hypothetical protein
MNKLTYKIVAWITILAAIAFVVGFAFVLLHPAPPVQTFKL